MLPWAGTPHALDASNSWIPGFQPEHLRTARRTASLSTRDQPTSCLRSRRLVLLREWIPAISRSMNSQHRRRLCREKHGTTVTQTCRPAGRLFNKVMRKRSRKYRIVGSCVTDAIKPRQACKRIARKWRAQVKVERSKAAKHLAAALMTLRHLWNVRWSISCSREHPESSGHSGQRRACHAIAHKGSTAGASPGLTRSISAAASSSRS